MRADATVYLTDPELAALARRLLARHISGDIEWLEWESVPHLDEATFERLCVEVQTQATVITDDVDNYDRSTGIDSRYLYERASGGPAGEVDHG